MLKKLSTLMIIILFLGGFTAMCAPLPARSTAIVKAEIVSDTIFIKTLTGKTIKINASPGDSVITIKRRIEAQEDIPTAQQRLIYAGKQLEDEKLLADYNILAGAVLHLVLRLKAN